MTQIHRTSCGVVRHLLQSKAGLIAWDLQFCWSKVQGGLGFSNVITWNIAWLGKYIWVVATKKDNVWLKWVN